MRGLRLGGGGKIAPAPSAPAMRSPPPPPPFLGRPSAPLVHPAAHAVRRTGCADPGWGGLGWNGSWGERASARAHPRARPKHMALSINLPPPRCTAAPTLQPPASNQGVYACYHPQWAVAFEGWRRLQNANYKIHPSKNKKHQQTNTNKKQTPNLSKQ